METGIREFGDNLNRYLRCVEAGERVTIAKDGKIVAELVPPTAVPNRRSSRFDELIASGIMTPPAEDGDPLEELAELGLPRGTATALIDSERDEDQGGTGQTEFSHG